MVHMILFSDIGADVRAFDFLQRFHFMINCFYRDIAE